MNEIIIIILGIMLVITILLIKLNRIIEKEKQDSKVYVEGDGMNGKQ